MANIFLDTNIILELFFHRSKYNQVVAELSSVSELDGITISILSVTFFMYHVEKQNRSLSEAHDFLGKYQILDMKEADYNWAQANDQGDFEDALQVACALRHGCKKIITLDRLLAKNHDKHIEVTLTHG